MKLKDKIEIILISPGWRRLWLAISVMWVGFWAILTIMAFLDGYTDITDLVLVTLLAAIVPIGSLLAGRVIRWVIRGFIS